MAKVTMPQLGESVAEGTIGKWLKQPGDAVAKYEPLLEVITDKVNAEVPSPFAGVLKEILAEEGATVPNNAEIAVIETEEEAGGAGCRARGARATEAAPSATDGGGPKVEAPAETAATGGGSNGSAAPAPAAQPEPERPERAAAARRRTTAAPTATAPPAHRRRGRADESRGPPPAPRTRADRGPDRRDRPGRPDHPRRRARGGRADAHRRTGTGPAAARRPGPRRRGPRRCPARAPSAAPAAPSAGRAGTPSVTRIEFPAGADEVLVPLTQMRKGIAAQMTRALQAPHAYVQMEIDATRLVAFRERAKKAYQAKEGISLSYVPFVVKASAEALKRNPTFNAHWTDDGLLAKRRINIGVAVAVDEGLIVPVIRDADTLSIHGLNLAITDVANRARANKLRVDDFGGGTFTVDNTGYLGTNLVMPILNVPEVGIVTMEAITKRPVVVSTPDGDVIAIRPVMNMVLAVDHRANDGAGGAALLRDIKAWLEGVGTETPIY